MLIGAPPQSTLEDAAQVINNLGRTHVATIFRHKYQMNVHLENAMPPVSNIIVFFNRLSIIQL